MVRLATAAMGTRFELVLPGGERAAGEAALAEVDDWHRRLTRFAPDSWVSHVGRVAADRPVACDEALWALLVDAHAVWQASGGAFDITRGHGEALVLDPAARTIAFTRQGVGLDLGAIGKGHAIDAAMSVLRDGGVTSAFLHGGTSSGYGLGADHEGRPWRVAFGATPVTLTADSPAFSVSATCTASGVHIVDARARSARPDIPPRSARRFVARECMVIGPSARLADAWSTALVVLGQPPERWPRGYQVIGLSAGIRPESRGRRSEACRAHNDRWSPETRR